MFPGFLGVVYPCFCSWKNHSCYSNNRKYVLYLRCLSRTWIECHPPMWISTVRNLRINCNKLSLTQNTYWSDHPVLVIRFSFKLANFPQWLSLELFSHLFKNDSALQNVQLRKRGADLQKCLWRNLKSHLESFYIFLLYSILHSFTHTDFLHLILLPVKSQVLC